MVDKPEMLSPLEELAMPKISTGEPGVELSERLCASLVQVQAWPDTIAKVEKILTGLKGDVTVMASGPGRWLVEDDEPGLEEALRKKIPTASGAVTGLTHGRVVVSISGPKAEWVLASGIAVDFDVAAFPVGETQLTHHHEIGLTLHRTGEDSFDLYVFTSLSRGFWQWITSASEEVGYSVS